MWWNGACYAVRWACGALHSRSGSRTCVENPLVRWGRLHSASYAMRTLNRRRAFEPPVRERGARCERGGRMPRERKGREKKKKGRERGGGCFFLICVLPRERGDRTPEVGAICPARGFSLDAGAVMQRPWLGEGRRREGCCGRGGRALRERGRGGEG